MFKKILVTTDGSSDKAIAAAVEFAQQVSGSIVGISVVEHYPFSSFPDRAMTEQSHFFEDHAREITGENVQKVANAAQAAKVTCETVIVQSGTPHGEILNAAGDKKCDVIFMASHGRKRVCGLFAGGKTQKVLADTSIPVLVFR